MKLVEIAESVEAKIIEQDQARKLLGFMLRGETVTSYDEKNLEVIGVKLDFREVEEYSIEYNKEVLWFNAV